MPVFSGFPREMITFFRGLKKNNNREWFQERKGIYEEKVKAPMTQLVEALNAEFVKAAPEYVTEPSKAIYRIYRDTRFSKDKTPYKDHVGALFIHRQLDKHSSGGFYVGASAEAVEVAGGVYMPGPEQLIALRQALAARHTEFAKLAAGRKLRDLMGELKGESLARMPKGFPADHPAGDLLRRKQWYWYVTLDADLALSSRLLQELKKRVLVMLPAVSFFNAPLLTMKKKQSGSSMYF
jgi:uncharacterized protein (TIGR02453 family)